MRSPLAVGTLVFAVVAVWALVLAGAPASSSNAAHAQPPQVALTASYSIVGGGGTGAQDLLTYVSDGVQQVVPLTGSSAIYMADVGTQWSAETILNGSTHSERWITTQDVSGNIGTNLTVSFSYYHQYLVSFNYNVPNGAAGSTGPSVSYDQTGSQTSSFALALVWVDASSPYSYDSQLPGSSSNERWVLQSGGSGTVTQPASFTETYHHEFLVSSSFSVVGGGAPTPPSLSSTVLGTPVGVVMTSSIQGTWFDAGANYTFTSKLTAPTQSANETWIGTVLVQKQGVLVLSTEHNGTVNSPLSITPVFYHQFFVSIEFSFVGGTPNGLIAPTFAYEYFGNKASVSTETAVWVDSGTQYTVPATVCCPKSPTTERWVLYNSTAGTLASPTTISSTYFHEYFDSFAFSIVGTQPPPPLAQLALTYLVGGNAQHIALLETPQAFWADANSNYSATSTLSASTATERWFSPLAAGSIVGPAPNTSITIAYQQQYLITIVGGGIPTEWVNAGSNSALVTPAVYGRSQGTGSRVVSYQIDSGSVVPIYPPTAALSIPLAVNGPHTIEFKSVTQFQLSLDPGAAGGLQSITPPTIPGDDYWYDTGSQVQVVLAGTWGRADGVGHRMTSISVTGGSTIQVNSVGTVQAFSTPSLLLPVSITTTSALQYEVVLNGPALAAFSTISPPSTFPGDTYWYDSGSPAVTVVLNGAYSRSAGTGLRTTSWELDSGPVTKLAQAGPVTIVTKAMSAAQFVNATSATQYQVTLDKGGSSALASITSPTIPLDSGWYDASSPMGLVMNGVWGRASGTGQRLAAFSLNGGPDVTVASSGPVTVLNLMTISSPQAITTTVVTQYQVTLDGGATSSLFSITPTPIPLDRYWYDGGTPVSVSLDGVWGRTATSGSRLLSYSVNQGAPTPAALSSSPMQVLSVSSLNGPESIATKAETQFRLTASPSGWASVTGPTIPGDAPGWFDTGTSVKAIFDSVWNQTSAGSRESVTGYTINGLNRMSLTRSGNATFSITLSMTQSQSIALTSVTQFLLTVVGPAQVTASPPSQTGDSYFDSGSKVTFTITSVLNGTSGPRMRETLASYSVDGAAPTSVPSSASSSVFTTPAVTFSGAHTLGLVVVKQYLITFQFFDGQGRNQVEPTQVQLGVGNSTVDVQVPLLWLENGTSFTVVNVTWEGASVGPQPPPSYQVKSSPLNVTLDTQVYPASLKVVDLFGLPVSGARVSMNLANGTTVTGVTKGDGTFSAGMTPFGTFTAKVTSLWTSVRISGNGASVKAVSVGTVALSLISLLVVLAAAAAIGSAGVLLLLRKRKRGNGAAQQVSEPK